MTGRIRFIISTAQGELLSAVKTGLQYRPGIEMFIGVTKPSEAENKFTRQFFNVLLVDLDTAATAPDLSRIQSYKLRYGVTVLYTSCSAARGNFSGRSGDDFMLKPVNFTQLTAAAYAANLSKRLDSIFKQALPPVTRDLSKLVPDHSSAKVLAIASSTGGTSALEQLLKQLPADIPPTVLVQHMPSGFTKLFADRLNNTYKQDIKEAETGDYVKRGQMLLAPADRHMKLIRQQGKLAVECFYGVKMHGVMPAADVLFETVAEFCKANAVGVILTGMGADGARGLLQMHNAGAKTIGQDEKSCVVYGMPKVAKQLGAVDFELPLTQIAEKIMALV